MLTLLIDLAPITVVAVAVRLVIAWRRASDVIAGCPVCADPRHEADALAYEVPSSE